MAYFPNRVKSLDTGIYYNFHAVICYLCNNLYIYTENTLLIFSQNSQATTSKFREYFEEIL